MLGCIIPLVRLTSEQSHLIKDVIHRRFGERSRIWLFGSRTDDGASGGDIDLYIEPDTIGGENLYLIQLETKQELEKRLRHAVDLVIRRDAENAFMRAAKREGTPL